MFKFKFGKIHRINKYARVCKKIDEEEMTDSVLTLIEFEN